LGAKIIIAIADNAIQKYIPAKAQSRSVATTDKKQSAILAASFISQIKCCLTVASCLLIVQYLLVFFTEIFFENNHGWSAKRKKMAVPILDTVVII
jgi:hypothetical protein